MKKIKVVEYEFNQSETEDDYILADTSSDSDGSVDPELGPADYWCCLRCKNPSNNPLYSFCEKCFQVSIIVQKFNTTFKRMNKKINKNGIMNSISPKIDSQSHQNIVSVGHVIFRLCIASVSVGFAFQS